MSINTETLNRRLFKILSKYQPKPLDTSGDPTDVEDDADVFKFKFTMDGEEYGDVYATIDDSRALNIYFDDSVTESPSSPTPGLDYNDTWSGLMRFLSQWAMRNQLSWNPDNNKDHLVQDMARRKHMKKKEQVAEGYYPMGKKASYSDAVPTVKIVIEHTRQIEEGEQRYRNVNRIFLENTQGERILAPTTKPGVARVYARHIAEGGLPHDDRWNHIIGLCEEYNKMAGFVRATRNGQFNESAQQLVSEGVNHYNKLRESLSKMTGKRGYNMYFESWTPPLMEDDADTSNINELFVQETLDPRIESVMPILSKLHKTVAEMKEVSELSEWADSLLEGGDGGEASEETDGDTAGDAGEGGAEDSPDDNLTEEESLTSNNPGGIPEGRLDGSDDIDSPVANAITRRILLQRTDLLSKYGPEKVSDAIGDVCEFVGDVEEIGSSDVSGWVKQVERSLSGEQVEESGLQAYLGNKKYGKKGMDALRKAGRKHASKKKMQNIRAEFSNKEKGVTEDAGSSIERILAAHPEAVENFKQGGDLDYDLESDLWDYYFNKGDIRNYDADASEFISQSLADELGLSEGLDADQERVGQLGPTEKVKNNNIGKLVGANENFINTDAQAVVTEVDTGEYDARKSGYKGETTPEQEKDFRKKVQAYSKELEQRQKEKEKEKVKEGQEDLAAMLRIINR